MKNSYLTVTDQFCGAGGSTLGAKAAGVEVRQALNHWKVAVETYAANHPNTDVDCTNVSQTDPRRYRSTDILITSPECTTHSPAGGNRRRPKAQLDAFIPPAPDDPSFVRSRVTAWDVVRFAEVHRYEIVIAENVFEFTKWELFGTWLAAMHRLGYRHKVVSLNSMFCWPTPQSRDRVYVVFWKKGNRAPDLDFRPRAWCPRCERQIDAVQTWKNWKTIGKYRQQYVYSCPKCRIEVTPYYFAALNAIDLSIPCKRIGDRKDPLAPRTLDRVRYGVGKYGRRALLIRVTNSYGNNRGVSDSFGPAPTQTGRQDVALLSPAFLVSAGGPQVNPRGVEAPMNTALARDHMGLVRMPGFLIPYRSERDGQTPRTHSLAGPTPAMTSEIGAGLVMPFVATQRTNATGTGLHEALTTMCGGNHHLLIQGSALLTLRDHPRMQLRGLDAPMSPQLAKGPHDAIISPSPFLLTYDRHNLPTGLNEPIATVTTIDRTALIGPDEELPDVEDCYFRMVVDREVGRAMAFPDAYVVIGTKRDRVKQYGNAVTPPAMDRLVRRCIASLHPEVA